MGYSLSTLDLFVVGAYFLVVLGIGLYISFRTHTSDDLFLAGRSLSWPAIGFSLFASNISSTTLIGLAGAAYISGISVANYEWMAAIVLIIFVFFVAPVYAKARIGTVPEYFLRRFDRRSGLYFSGMTIVFNILIDTAGSLYAGALVLQLFFPTWDMTLICVGLALVAGLYTVAGGLKAVVYTDVIQAVVLMVGSMILAYAVYQEMGGDWQSFVEQTPESYLSLIRPLDDPHLPWLGTLIGVPVLGFYFWCTNQFIVQRLLAAKDLASARWGALLGGGLKLPVLFIMVLPGTMGRLLFPDLERGDLVFPTLVLELLPSGLIGLVLAGLVAAIMSSVDSTLNSASTLVTLDFVKPRAPHLSEKQLARLGRGVMVLFMTLAALWAPQIAHFSGLFQYLQEMLAYFVPPIAAVFVLGLFYRRAHGLSAFLTLILSHGFGVVLFGLSKGGGVELPHFTIVAGLLFGMSLLLGVGLSQLKGSVSQDEKVRFTSSDFDGSRLTGLFDYRLLSLLLLLTTLVMVGMFF